MTVLMRGTTDEKKGGGGGGGNPTFHDFLRMSWGDAPPAAIWEGKGGGGDESKRAREAAELSATASASASCGRSDLVIERLPINNYEGLQLHSRRSDISVLEASNQFSGRKRSNSDSAFMGSMRERMLPAASDSPESSHFMKMLRKEVLSERPRRPHVEVMLTMQPPQRTSSLVLNPPINGRPDSFVSKWENSMSLNPGPTAHYPSRFGQRGTNIDKMSSSCTYRDSNVGATFISQAAADEGSRTGIKGAGSLNATNSGVDATEKNSAGMSGSNKHKGVAQNAEPDPSSIPSRCGISPASRQMTVFYAGQAHVFDDVHPNKADIIMALAGSNGGSWSTTYSAKPSVCPPSNDAKVPTLENKMGISNSPFSQDLNKRLVYQGTSNYGYGQVARIPVVGDPSNLTAVTWAPAGLQGEKAIGNGRPTTQAIEPDTASKQNV